MKQSRTWGRATPLLVYLIVVAHGQQTRGQDKAQASLAFNEQQVGPIRGQPANPQLRQRTYHFQASLKRKSCSTAVFSGESFWKIRRRPFLISVCRDSINLNLRPASLKEASRPVPSRLDLGACPRCGQQPVRAPAATVRRLKLKTTEIFDLAAYGDVNAQRSKLRMADCLVMAVTNLILVLDLSIVVLGAGVGGHPALLSPIRQKLEQNQFARPELVMSSLGGVCARAK
jgi:hypothetical protein